MGQEDDARQLDEIEALKAIFDDDFIETKVEKAWKGAASLREFSIRVKHPTPLLADKFGFHVHIMLPKGYPSKATPSLRVVKQTSAFPVYLVDKLDKSLKNEMQSLKGSEMLFHLITICQDLLTTEFPESKFGSIGTSLAAEMVARETERSEAERIAQDHIAQADREREAHAAAQMALEIQHNADKKAAKQRQEKELMKSRNRALSDATERIYNDPALVESFDEPILLDSGPSFNSVRLLHLRKDNFGTTYQAEPICEDESASPMEMQIITFDSPYYRSAQGRRKLQDIATEIHHLSKTHDKNAPRIVVLAEPFPKVTLHDVLNACGGFPVDTVLEFSYQLLCGLSTLHGESIVHKCLKSSLIAFNRATVGQKGQCKIFGASYLSRIAALNKSNHVGLLIDDELRWPDTWLSKEMVTSPLVHLPTRDIHSLGILALELYHGLSIFDNFKSPSEALVSVPAPLQAWVAEMINPKHATVCDTLLQSFPIGAQTPTLKSQRYLGVSRSINPPGSPLTPIQDTIRRPALNAGTRSGSRYISDWEELEFLGKGGFGQVVKARNKLDNRIYAIKKIHLRSNDNEAKILREVNALARLSHRWIVRYYTTWLELSDGMDTPSPSGTDSESISNNAMDTTIRTSSRSVDIFQVDLNDLTSSSRHNSFPGIYFTEQSELGDDAENEDDQDDASVIDAPLLSSSRIRGSFLTSILYIQMEYVENLTLKERIGEGLDEEEAWRLLHQLIDALVHMSNLGILHRDIKLGNIFIDANGDCKIGDFGLATSNEGAVETVEQSDTLRSSVSDLTMDVGTRLYVAPELIARSAQKGPKMHSKADMYSLGIVFFEMNHRFQTSSERVAVLEGLRTPPVIFPDSWEPRRRRQREIIQSLLQHDVSVRPSALELSQSPLVPSRLEDDSLKAALNSMAKNDSPYYDSVMSLLFSQDPSLARAAIYDADIGTPEHGSLDDVIEQRVREVFVLHGAVQMHPQLLIPALTSLENDKSSVYLLDRQGDLVTLPRNHIVSFARLAARTGATRIKRYHMGDVYRSSVGGGHPSFAKAAVFDIITPSLTDGVELAVAECMRVASEILRRFPSFSTPPYEFRISHTLIGEQLLSRVSEQNKADVLDILGQSKPSFPQKRAALSQLGINRTIIDEIEVLCAQGLEVESFLLRLKKLPNAPVTDYSRAFEEIKLMVHFSAALGIATKTIIQPFNPFPHHFKDGVMFELTKGSRRGDVLAAGGRYDHLFSSRRDDSESIRAIGMQIALDKIGVALAQYQSNNVKSFIKDQKTFGYWSPGRCDVYVISHLTGQQNERLETAAMLWSHGISADIMYESGVQDGAEAIHELCMREGILLTVSPRSHRTGAPGYKVTTTLTRTDQEVSKTELVPYLLQHLAEQKRVDLTTSGILTAGQLTSPQNDKSSHQTLDIQLLLPSERKQLKHNKKLLYDKAHEMASLVRGSFVSGIPVVAMHVSAASFSAMIENPGWLSDEEHETFRKVTATFSAPTVYASQIREGILKRKDEGHKFILLLSLRDERLHLLTLH